MDLNKLKNRTLRTQYRSRTDAVEDINESHTRKIYNQCLKQINNENKKIENENKKYTDHSSNANGYGNSINKIFKMNRIKVIAGSSFAR